MKIATYNIKHASDNARYATHIGKLIREEELDIVGIQEIDYFCNRSGNVDVLKLIAEESGLPFYRFYKTINWQNGDYGVGVLSRYPFDTEEVVALPNCKEQRILVSTRVRTERGIVPFLVTHLELGPYQDIRKEQHQEILKRVQELDTFILTGDFNCEDWTTTGFFELAEHFGSYQMVNNPSNTFLTYSGKECIGGGILPIDNIIMSQNIEVLNTYMVDTEYSDHDILISEIKFKERKI